MVNDVNLNTLNPPLHTIALTLEQDPEQCVRLAQPEQERDGRADHAQRVGRHAQHHQREEGVADLHLQRGLHTGPAQVAVQLSHLTEQRVEHVLLAGPLLGGRVVVQHLGQDVPEG